MSLFESKQTELQTKIGKFCASKVDKLELILATLFVICIILKIATSLPLSNIINFILIPLAILYFYSAYSIVKDENTKEFELISLKIITWACSVCTVGIIFRTENWPGSNVLLTFGCVAALISFLLVGILYLKKYDFKIISKRWIVRLLIITILAVVLKFAPSESLIKIGLHKKAVITKEK